MVSRSPLAPEPPSEAFPPVDRRSPRRRTWVQRTILGVGVVVVLGILAGIASVGYGIFRFGQINKENLSLIQKARRQTGGRGSSSLITAFEVSQVKINRD